MRHTRKNKKQKKQLSHEQVAIRSKSEFEQAMNRIGIFKITNKVNK